MSASGASATAPGAVATQSTQVGGKTTLQVYIEGGPDSQTLHTQKLLPAFQASRSGVTVDTGSASLVDDITKLRALFAAGTGSDAWSNGSAFANAPSTWDVAIDAVRRTTTIKDGQITRAGFNPPDPWTFLDRKSVV